MLRQLKIKTREQDKKIWFSDAHHDLFVWLDDSRQPLGFQFSYDKHQDEHCLSWFVDRGYSHSRIDSGEMSPTKYKMTPMLVTNGEFDATSIARRFENISRDMDTELRQFISDRIREAATAPATNNQ